MSNRGRSGPAGRLGRRWAARLGLIALAGGVGAAMFAVAPASAAPGGQDGGLGNGHAQRHAPWRFDESAVSMADVARIVGADRLWERGVTGEGVGVALVDTGVVPVEGLRSGNVVNGPDLSIESQAEQVRQLDTYGHGTHLAGIIAGSGEGFRGVAPEALLTSVKVGAYDGAVDVSQVIAAIDWVVAHRNDDPAHPIRVINLAYGTDGTQDYRLDPLTHAVENAWRAGVVVVAAAGNGGAAAPSLLNPAYDPYVIAVGAADPNGSVRTSDDRVADFSSRGSADRGVDLVAPGRSVVSLRNPGGAADESNPTARVGDRFFKGSGTSQAAAVVSGAVALLLDEHPELTPDQVKSLLTRTANRLPHADAIGQGAGELNVDHAAALRPGKARQNWETSTGLGTLEGARGSVHLAADTVLEGENDLFGPFDVAAWAAASSAGTAWDGGAWMGRDLTGSGWSRTTAEDPWHGLTWSGLTWSGRAWSGLTWSGLTWSGLTWSGRAWSGLTWSGLTWSGLTWSGLTWSGLTWSGLTWSGLTWSGLTWSGLTWSGITWSDGVWG